MLVSIVVPVYDSEQTLHRCLGSIAAQTHTELEVILVDDGSADCSRKICEDWAARDARFRVIHQENRGPGAARNAGMDCAAGKYIFFFDSDDRVQPTLVEQAVRRAEETGVQVVLYGCCHVYGNTKVVSRPLTAPCRVFLDSEIREELLPGLFTYDFGAGVSPWGKGYDLSFLRRNGLRFPEERGQVCEDGRFMLELFSKVSCAALIPDCLYHYYRTPVSLSRRFQEDRQQKNNAFLLDCMALVRDRGLPEKTVLHIRARYHGLTLGTMTALLRSGLEPEEKKRRLLEIFHDPVLSATLQDEVLDLDGALPRLFWRCLRRRQYRLSLLLLQANHLRQMMRARP